MTSCLHFQTELWLKFNYPVSLDFKKGKQKKKKKKKKEGKTAAMNEGCGFVKLSTLHTVDSR